jgi:hypothetical protein
MHEIVGHREEYKLEDLIKQQNKNKKKNQMQIYYGKMDKLLTPLLP